MLKLVPHISLPPSCLIVLMVSPIFLASISTDSNTALAALLNLLNLTKMYLDLLSTITHRYWTPLEPGYVDTGNGTGSIDSSSITSYTCLSFVTVGVTDVCPCMPDVFWVRGLLAVLFSSLDRHSSQLEHTGLLFVVSTRSSYIVSIILSVLSLT